MCYCLLENLSSFLLNWPSTESIHFHSWMICSVATMVAAKFLSNPISVAALLLLISIVVWQILTRKLRKKKYHPIAGTVFHQLLNFHRLHDYMTDLARKHKTYRLLGPFRNEIYTSDPPNVEYMLRTNFENFGKVSLCF